MLRGVQRMKASNDGAKRPGIHGVSIVEVDTKLEDVGAELKVLNLYAGIGGNRKLWGGVRSGCC